MNRQASKARKRIRQLNYRYKYLWCPCCHISNSFAKRYSNRARRRLDKWIIEEEIMEEKHCNRCDNTGINHGVCGCIHGERLLMQEKSPLSFALNKEEAEQIHEWIETHECKYPAAVRGSVGGDITFSFTPTAVGIFTKVSCCICNQELDVSNGIP